VDWAFSFCSPYSGKERGTPSFSVQLLKRLSSEANEAMANNTTTGYKDASFDYTFTVPAGITPNTIVRGGVVPINTDADFVWRAVYLTGNQNAFPQFRDSHGFPISDGFISPTQLNPLLNGGLYLIFPEMVFPAGGVIGVDYLAGGGPITLIVFRGVKRFGRC
jgi:hypothetical protein